MEKYLYGILCMALAIIAILVIPAGTISVSAVKPGGVREVIPAVGETQKFQPTTKDEVLG